MQPDDPPISRIATCRECGQPMGALRVYDGTTPGKQKCRGRVVQTVSLWCYMVISSSSFFKCTKGACHFTHFHTALAYEYTDTEKLVQRVIAQETGAPLPDSIAKAPLRLAPPPIVSDGSVHCANKCKSKSGTQTRGCQTCIELKCRSCCLDAAAEARRNNRPRGPCKTHKVDSVSDTPVIQQDHPPPLTPAHQPVNVRYTPATPPPTQPRAANVVAPAPTQHATHSAPGHPTPSQLPPTPHRSQNGRRQPLAQPIGPNWLQKKNDAESEKANIEAVKMRRLRMDEISKRTVELVVYYEVSI